MEALNHLALNTGRLRASPRGEVARAVVDLLLPLADAGGGPVPGMPGWHLAVVAPKDGGGRRLPGGAFFQLADEPGLSKRPVAGCMACWGREQRDVAWEAALSAYLGLRLPLQAAGLWRPPPSRPPPLPWLAAWLTPFAPPLAGPAEMEAFGGLERCFAWALMDGS